MSTTRNYSTFTLARSWNELYVKKLDNYQKNFLNKNSDKIALWNIINAYVKRSSQSGWDGPSHSTILEALGFEGEIKEDYGLDSDKDVLKQLIENEEKKHRKHGDSNIKAVPPIVEFGREIKRGREDVEKEAHAFVQWLESTTSVSDSEPTFRDEFVSAPFVDQARIAAVITTALSQSHNGRVFLARQFTESNAVFNPLEFFAPPLKPNTGVGIEDRSSLFRSDGTLDPTKAPLSLITNLARVAVNTVPGLLFHFANESKSSPALGSIGKFIASATTAFVPASRLDGVDINKFNAGNVTPADFGKFTESLLGQAETVLKNATEAEDAAKSSQAKLDAHISAGGFDATRALGAVNYALNIIGLVSKVVGKFASGDKITTQDVTDITKSVLTMRNFEDIAALFGLGATKKIQKAAVDAGINAATEAPEKVIQELSGMNVVRASVERIKKVAVELIGPIFDVLDIIWNYFDMQDAIDRGDYSVAIGYGMLGLSSASSIAATIAGAAGAVTVGSSATTAVLAAAAFGPWAFAAAVVFALVGWGLIAFTTDHPLTMWIQNGYFGSNWELGAKRYNDPSKPFFNWDSSADPGDTVRYRPNFARMLSSYFTLIFPIGLNEAKVYEKDETTYGIFNAQGIEEFYTSSTLTVAPVTKRISNYHVRDIWHRIRIGGRPKQQSIMRDPRIQNYIYEKNGLFVDAAYPDPSYAQTAWFEGNNPNFAIGHTPSRKGIDWSSGGTMDTVWKSVFYFDTKNVKRPSNTEEGWDVYEYLFGMEKELLESGPNYIEVSHLSATIQAKIGKMLKRGDLSIDPVMGELPIVPREQYRVEVDL